MAKDIIIPAAGESVTEADILQWHKKSGDYVERDEPLLELETDKASMDLAAETSGILIINVEEGTVKVGQIVGRIEEGGAVKSEPKAQSQKTDIKSEIKIEVQKHSPSSDESSSHYAAGHPSPAAKKILEEKNIHSSDVKGSGKEGRITKEDALQAKVISKSTAVAAIDTSVKTETGKRQTRREPLSRLRKTLMNRLVESQQVTASLTTFNEVDMSAVMNLRKEYKDKFQERYGIGLGFMSFFAKAATVALQKQPLVNAMIDGTDIVFNDFYDIGVAVSTPKGLIVPVIRNTDQLGFHDIEMAIRDYALRGRDGKVTMDEMTGGTFTITNGGTFGSMLSTPILNRPQSAILGMHNIVQRPVAVNGNVEIRPIMYLALTYDHRIIDGSDAVRFLVTIKELIEDPRRLLLGL